MLFFKRFGYWKIYGNYRLHDMLDFPLFWVFNPIAYYSLINHKNPTFYVRSYCFSQQFYWLIQMSKMRNKQTTLNISFPLKKYQFRIKNSQWILPAIMWEPFVIDLKRWLLKYIWKIQRTLSVSFYTIMGTYFRILLFINEGK